MPGLNTVDNPKTKDLATLGGARCPMLMLSRLVRGELLRRKFFLANLHLDCDLSGLLVADRDVRRDHSKAFVPRLKFVLPWRQIVKSELPI